MNIPRSCSFFIYCGLCLFALLRTSLADDKKWIWANSPPSWFSQLAKNDSELRIFWWNIHNGAADLSRRDLTATTNFLALTESSAAPDVIVLAEFGKESLPLEAMRILEAKYPYRHKVDYRGMPNYGLCLLSKIPFEDPQVEYLSYGLNHSGEKQKKTSPKNDSKRRPFVIYTIEKNQKKYLLAVTHINDFWRDFFTSKPIVPQPIQPLVPGASQIKLPIDVPQAAYQTLAGTNNAVYDQILSFKRKLERKVSSLSEDYRLIVLGDFNMPKSVLSLDTLGYATLAKGLREVLPPKQFSFPAEGSKEASFVPPILIDHAFISGKTRIKNASVLPLKGSHHYPLYLIVDTEKE